MKEKKEECKIMNVKGVKAVSVQILEGVTEEITL